jgi:hypothetical protein
MHYSIRSAVQLYVWCSGPMTPVVGCISFLRLPGKVLGLELELDHFSHFVYGVLAPFSPITFLPAPVSPYTEDARSRRG